MESNFNRKKRCTTYFNYVTFYRCFKHFFFENRGQRMFCCRNVTIYETRRTQVRVFCVCKVFTNQSSPLQPYPSFLLVTGESVQAENPSIHNFVSVIAEYATFFFLIYIQEPHFSFVRLSLRWQERPWKLLQF